MYDDQVTSRRPNHGHAAAHALSATIADPARTSPAPTADPPTANPPTANPPTLTPTPPPPPGTCEATVRTRTGRMPPTESRRAGARRDPAARLPSTPGTWPSISTTRVPSQITTPRSRRTRRRPRARAAGWMVAAPGMNTPSRNTGEWTRAATSAADSGTYRSPAPSRRHAATAASQLPSWAGAALTWSAPALVNQASTRCSAHQRPMSSTASSLA